MSPKLLSRCLPPAKTASRRTGTRCAVYVVEGLLLAALAVMTLPTGASQTSLETGLDDAQTLHLARFHIDPEDPVPVTITSVASEQEVCAGGALELETPWAIADPQVSTRKTAEFSITVWDAGEIVSSAKVPVTWTTNPFQRTSSGADTPSVSLIAPPDGSTYEITLQATYWDGPSTGTAAARVNETVSLRIVCEPPRDLRAQALAFHPGEAVFTPEGATYTPTNVPLTCTEYSNGKEIIFSGSLGVTELAGLQTAPDVHLAGGIQVIRKAPDAWEVVAQGFVDEDVAWSLAGAVGSQSIAVDFIHTTSAWEPTDYLLLVDVAAYWEGRYLRAQDEVAFTVPACQGLAGPLTSEGWSPADGPPPGFVEPPVGELLTPDLPPEGIAPTPTDLARDPAGEQDVDMPGTASAAAVSYSVNDKRMIKSWASPCSPGPNQRGFDATDAQHDFYYRITVSGPTRLDFYYVDWTTYTARHWWYADLPTAGTWCIVNNQALNSDWGDAIRGWWQMYVFIGGNGGFWSGSYVSPAFQQYTIEPYLYYFVSTEDDCPPHWTGHASTHTFHKTDDNVGLIGRWATTHITRPHFVDARFQAPGGPVYTAGFTVYPGYSAWETCAWVPMSTAREYVGSWTNRFQDMTQPFHYSRAAAATLVDRAPLPATITDPADGATIESPYIVQWTSPAEPDLDPIRFTLHTRPTAGGAVSDWCPDTVYRFCSVRLAPGTYDAWVTTTEQATSFQTATSGTISLTVVNSDRDNDGVRNSQDIDPDYHVRLEYYDLGIETWVDRTLQYRVEVEDLATNSPQCPAYTSPNLTPTAGRPFLTAGNTGLPAFTCNISNDIASNEMQVAITLYDNSTGTPTLIDIDDAAGSTRNTCHTVLDTTTGYWRKPAWSYGDGYLLDGGINFRNNGYGTCSSDSTAINDVRAFGDNTLHFDLRLTDADGDGMPRLWEEAHGLDGTIVDNEATTSGANILTDKMLWRLRKEPDQQNIGQPLTLRFWVSQASDGTGWPTGLSAAEQDALERQLKYASMYLREATDGHVWIDRFEEVNNRYSSDLQIYRDCARQWMDPHWPQAVLNAYRPGTGNFPGITMPMDYQGCSATNALNFTNDPYFSDGFAGHGGGWARTLAHEFGHYGFNILDEYGGPDVPGHSTVQGPGYNATNPNSGFQWAAHCYAETGDLAWHGNATSLMDSQHGLNYHQIDGPTDIDLTNSATNPPGPCWPSLQYKAFGGNCYRFTCRAGDNETAWESMVTRLSAILPGMNWDFDHDGNMDAPGSLSAANFMHILGPMDPIDRWIDVEWV